EESKARVKDLEDTISEGNAQIAEMQNTIEGNAATIAALEAQLNEAQKPQTDSSGNSNTGNNSGTPIQPSNPPTGLGNMGTFGGIPTGTGTGAAPGTLGVGTFE
ncbi:MAG: hypothetical protein NC548_32710, partial [Lachnospiraceae bacterium]|nr:hypothetical protein [Lachnospiraceae bacterium]